MTVPCAAQGVGQLAQRAERERGGARDRGGNRTQRGTQCTGVVLDGRRLGKVGPYEQRASCALPQDARPATTLGGLISMGVACGCCFRCSDD